ncbi:MAG: hypothetical protein PGN07_02150 [Aeromicrobium erythreum]
MSDQVRVDRGAVQNHTDATLANQGQLRQVGDQVDRQQAHLKNMMEGGAGSENVAATQASARRHGADIDAGVTKNAQRTSENADEFISSVKNAANSSFRNI